MTHDAIKAALIADAAEALLPMFNTGQFDQLRAILHSLIADPPPEQAHKAVDELFDEIAILADVYEESHGYTRPNDDWPDKPPF